MASDAEEPKEEPKHYLVQRIREALAHDPRVSEIELQVTVRGSKVFVAGAVSTEDRRQAVTEVVQEAAPDCEVHNETRASFRPGEVEEEELG
jgi:osmotically-inducible protein OsmY